MKAGTVVMNRVSQPEFLAEVIEKGKRVENAIKAIKDKVSIIGDIRAKGLMIGTEFINPKAEPDLIGSYPASGEIAARVQQLCFENGLVVEKGGRHGSVMRCLCALNITNDEIDQAMKIFEKAVLIADKEMGKA